MRFLFSIIIVVCVLAIAATIATIIVGSESFEGIVVDKPYETGLAWDAMNKETMRLGWTIGIQNESFKSGKNELFLRVFGKDGLPLDQADVSIKITRPATVEYDKTYRTTLQPDGRYRAAIDLPLYGNWDVIVDVSRGRDRISFKRSLFAEKASS